MQTDAAKRMARTSELGRDLSMRYMSGAQRPTDTVCGTKMRPIESFPSDLQQTDSQGTTRNRRYAKAPFAVIGAPRDQGQGAPNTK